MTQFVIKTASAKMPASCKGHYRRVAVLEVEDGVNPPIISERAEGVVRVVRTWEKCHVGTTDKDAYSKALFQAAKLVEELTNVNER